MRVFQTELQLRDVGSLQLAVVARGDLELDRSALIERFVAVHLDFAPVDEQVLATLLGDEAVAFFRVEPLNSTLRHFKSFFLSPRIDRRGNAARRMATALALPSRARGSLYDIIRGKLLTFLSYFLNSNGIRMNCRRSGKAPRFIAGRLLGYALFQPWRYSTMRAVTAMIFAIWQRWASPAGSK